MRRAARVRPVLAVCAALLVADGCSGRVPRGWTSTRDPSGSCEVAAPAEWKVDRDFFLKREPASTLNGVKDTLPPRGFELWGIDTESATGTSGRAAVDTARVQLRTAIVRGNAVCSVWRVRNGASFTAEEADLMQRVARTLQWTGARAAARPALPGVATLHASSDEAWGIISGLTSEHSSDSHSSQSDTHAVSSQGKTLDDTKTHDSDPSGRTDSQTIQFDDGQGNVWSASWNDSTDSAGNRYVNTQDSHTDESGTKVTSNYFQKFDRTGKLVDKNSTTVVEKVPPPPKRKAPAEEPPRPPKPSEPPPGPEPPAPPPQKKTPSARTAARDGIEVKLSLHATPDCQAGRDAVMLEAAGTMLPTDASGKIFSGPLDIQKLTVNGFECSESYISAGGQMVGGEQVVTITQRRPSAELMLQAMVSPQLVSGGVRVGNGVSVDRVSGGEHNAFSSGLNFVVSSMLPGWSPAVNLTAADLTNGFARTYAIDTMVPFGESSLGEADIHTKYQWITRASFHLTGSVSLRYRNAALPRQPRDEKEEWLREDAQIFGCSLQTITQQRARRMGLPTAGALVTAVPPKSHSPFAEGDLVVGVNGRAVASALEVVAAVGAAPNGSVSAEIVRGGQRMTVVAQK